MALFYHDFTNKNIEPIINIEENIPNIISDETALTRIFTNLINNMLKHGKDTVIINLAQKKDKLVAEFINHAPDLQQDQISHILIASLPETGLGAIKIQGWLMHCQDLAEQLAMKLELSL